MQTPWMHSRFFGFWQHWLLAVHELPSATHTPGVKAPQWRLAEGVTGWSSTQSAVPPEKPQQSSSHWQAWLVCLHAVLAK